MKLQNALPLTAALALYQPLNPNYALAETPVKSQTNKNKTETPKKEEKEQVHGMVEILAGNQSGTLDTKILLPIAPYTKIFNRNRITGLYQDGSVSNFHILSLNINPYIPGLDIVAEVDATSGAGLEPRAGLQYFRKFGDFGMVGFSSIALKKNPTGLLMTNLSYNPKFTELLGLASNAELSTTLSKYGHNVSVQRLRLGLDIAGYQFGPAADLKEITNHDNENTAFSYNVGGFFKKNF